MQGVQKKHLVIMPQYISMARKQLKFLMRDMVEVIDNTPIPIVISYFKTLINGALKNSVKRLGSMVAKPIPQT